MKIRRIRHYTPGRDVAKRHALLEGLLFGIATCLQCGHAWDAALQPDVNVHKLPCPGCEAEDSLFAREQLPEGPKQP